MKSLSFSQISLKTFKTQDNIRVKYSYFESKNNENDEPKYLVIALHWGWGEKLPDYYSKSFLKNFIIPIYEDKNVIIVAPDCPDDSWIKTKSINAVLELRSHYLEKFNLDTNKIILTGFSLGGIGTWYFATNYSELFPNCMPIAGYAPAKWVNKNNISKIYAINSFNDEIIPISKLDDVKSIIEKDENSGIIFKTIYGVGHYNTGLFIQPSKEGLEELLRFE